MADTPDTPQRHSMKTRIRWVIAMLICLGLAGTGLRIWLAHAHPQAANGQAWDVDMTFHLSSSTQGAAVALAPPWDSRMAHLYNQQLTLDGLRLQRTRKPIHGQRRIEMTTRRAGPVALEATFSIHQFDALGKHRPEKVTLEPEERQHYLAKAPGVDTDSAAVQRTADRIASARAENDDPVQAIFQYVRDHVAYSARHGASSATQALASHRANDLGRARAMVALCRTARFPARVVTGFRLAPQSHARPWHWVQVYRRGRWRSYDPTEGYSGELPVNYVAFAREGSLLSTRKASLQSATYRISNVDVPPSIAENARRNPLNILDLGRLPLSARETLATLLLLPLGALLNTFVRSVVGVQTFGTFTPAMLALAAVYVDWLTATVIFLVVSVIALLGRSTLPGLKLSRSPRLTIVFALVALAMALAISIMAYFNLLTGAQVVLLPIVILTSLVDRIYTVVDERGLHTALMRLLWTGITAIGCFFILTDDALGDLLVHYPELHLITLALVLVLAAYSGPKLARLPGLRWVGEPERTRDKTAVEE